MAEIVVEHLTHSFEQDRVVLDDVSFQINALERVGLLGANGAGKTTLLKIIAGRIKPDAGGVTIARGKKVGYVEQLTRHPDGMTGEDILRLAFERVFELEKRLLTAGEDAAALRQYAQAQAEYEALGGYDWQVKLNKVAAGLGVTAEMRAQTYSTLSGGEQMRLNLAKLLLEDADILLLDEPTNHLDADGMRWLEEYLAGYRGALIVVSHDRYFLDNVVRRVVEISRLGIISLYEGNYSYYVTEKQRRYKQQLKQYQAEQAKIRQLEDTARRMHQWAQAYDNPALHKRAFAIERRVEWIRQTDKPIKDEEMRVLFRGAQFRAAEAVVAVNLGKSFGGRALIEPFSAVVGGGERVCVIGANGTGKTTLINMLMGEEAPSEGKCKLGPSARALYLKQKLEFEHPGRTLYDTLLYELKLEPQQARDRLGMFMFRGEDVFKTVSQLSGGEKMRLKLCLLMNERVNLIVLDEPTNHLDIASREWIEQAIKAFEGVVVFVSHDRYFIRRFATRIWEINGGKLRDFKCGYDKYVSIREKELIIARERAQSAEKPAAPRFEARARADRQSARARRRLSAVEREIYKKEEYIEELRRKTREHASDYERLIEITREIDAENALLKDMYSEWEALETESGANEGGKNDDD